jgi:hypothetical protein
MEQEKTKFIQFSNASNLGRFALVNRDSISSITQKHGSDTVVVITLKEIKNGENVSFEGNYDLPTLTLMLNN